MSEFAFIYVFLIAFFMCIAAILIIRVVEKKSAIGEKEDDIFTKFIENRKRMLEVNMPNISIKTYMVMSFASPIVFGIILWFLIPNKLFGLGIAAFGVLLPDLVIRLIIEMRRKRYEEKYVRALKSFSSSMKAGLSIQQAIREVMNNQFVAPEIREGFRQIDSDVRVGISIEDAFRTFAEKADNDDARDVASAIAMQSYVGGSEGKVIESIATNIEDRLMTKKKIRSIFSSTDFMVNAFDVMPFLAIVIMCVTMPDYVAPILNDTVASILVIVLLLFTVIGSVFIRRKIRVAKGE